MKDNYIRSVDGHGYWSNEFGWVGFKEQATLFTDEETQKLHLPDGGRWENDR